MNSIKQKPYSQATGSSAGQEIIRILWNKSPSPYTHNSPPLTAILIQMSPFPNVPFHLFQNQLNIISNLHLGSPCGLCPSGCISIPQVSHDHQNNPPVSIRLAKFRQHVHYKDRFIAWFFPFIYPFFRLRPKYSPHTNLSARLPWYVLQINPTP